MGPLLSRIIKTKKLVAELGHSDILSVYESSFAEMPISPLLKIAENIKQAKFYEIPNGFGQNMCQTVAFTPLLKAQCRCDVAFRGILV